MQSPSVIWPPRLKPLQVYTGILPSPDATLPTIAAQLAGTRRRAIEVQCDRHVLVDQRALRQSSSAAPWDALFTPAQDLPLRLFLPALHRGYSPSSTASLRLLAASLASQGPLHPTLTHAALRRPSSWATSVDNFPPALLSRAEGGLHAACHRIAQLRRAGQDTIISNVTQYGSYKGPPKPPHLFESHRPLSVASPLVSFEAGSACQLIRATMELSGAATPELFAYRAEIQPAYMVFAVRASMLRTLPTYGSVAAAKWDESHAYFRIPRASAKDTLTLTPHVWDFSEWFQWYYSSRSVRILTDVGFTDPIVTREGADQGCPAADQCFQGTQACLNTTMTVYCDVSLPSPRGPLPCSRAGFSDDRIFTAPSLCRVVQAVTECIQRSRAVGRVPNPGKLEYYLVSMATDTLHHVVAIVPDMDAKTKAQPPTLVGIPLLSQLPVRCALAKDIPVFRRTGARLATGDPMNPVLRIRAFYMYALAKLEYITHGVLLPQPSLTTLQVITNRHYRRVYRLPKWTPVWFLCSFLHLGGAGCPALYLRNVVQLAATLLRAATCRHPLARAGAQYLLHDGHPLSDTPHILRVLQPHGFQLHSIPGPTLSPCRLHITGTTDALRHASTILLAYDAAVRHDRVGIAAVAWQPTVGELFTVQAAFPIYAPTSTIAEWFARLIPLWLLRLWSGLVILVTDSTDTCTHRLTRGPPAHTVLARYFRHIMAACEGLRYNDVWTQAQHATHHDDILSLLNRRAHDLSQNALPMAKPRTIPLPEALTGCTLGSIDGGPLYDIGPAMDGLYHRVTSAPMVRCLNDWDAMPWQLLHQRGELPEADVYRTMQFRLYALAPSPVEVGCYPCPFCLTSVHHLASHIRDHCPYACAALIRAASVLWTSSYVLRATELVGVAPLQLTAWMTSDGITLCDPRTSIAFGVQFGTSVPVPSQAMQTAVVYSLAGLWHVRSPPGHPPAIGPEDQSSLMRRLSSITGPLRPRQTLPEVLRAIPHTISARPVAWRTSAYPDCHTRVILNPSTQLSIDQSFLLTFVMRLLPWSRLYLANAPALALPAPSLTPDELYIVCALGASPQQWYLLQALTTGWCPRVYVLPCLWSAATELLAYAPARTVYTGQDAQVVITHGVPWDNHPFTAPRPQPCE